jgi:UreD urease accessory protein
LLADTPAQGEIFAGNRAIGGIFLSILADADGSRRQRVREEGALRVRFPNAANREILEAVTVNTAGGMTGGDRFDLDIAVGAGAQLMMTTAAAEKIYRSTSGSRLAPAVRSHGCRRRPFSSIRFGCAVRSRLTWRRTPASSWPKASFSAGPPWAKR